MTLERLRFSLSEAFLLDDPRRAEALPPEADVSGESYEVETVVLPVWSIASSGDLPAELSGEDELDSS